jgi:ferredoxin-thioredoxin reductase catalytic chain
VLSGKIQVQGIPERRPPGGPVPRRNEEPPAPEAAAPAAAGHRAAASLAFPVWRCKVCGYLCARDGPPEVCPICKARKDRFERFC